MVATLRYYGIVVCLTVISTLNFSEVMGFLVKPSDTLVLHGDSTQLNCTYDGAPDLKAWYCGNKLIFLRSERRDSPGDYELVSDGDEYNLIVHNATIEDEEEYICTDLDNLDREAVASLYVIENSTQCTLNQTNTTVITGDNVTFICTMELDEEAPGDLVWYRDGSEVSRVTGMENVWTTTLYDGDNGATFYCRLEHFTLPRENWDVLVCEDTITMNVQFGPSVAISNVTGTAGIEGDHFAALCEITQNGNPPDIDEVYWINPENNTIFNGSALLEIETLDRADAGQYQCVMSNTLHDGSSGIGKASFILDVQYPYELSITNTTGAVAMEGDFYAAKCDIEETGNPAEIFEQFWLDPTGAEVNDGEYTLQIGAIDRSDGGQYACVVSNTYYNDLQGIGEATTHIDVQYSPDVIINDISDARVIENDRYEANCTVDANPTATTAWKYTADNVTVVDVYLTIERAQRHHAGAYKCESNNTLYTGDTGYGYDTIELDVQYVPIVSTTDNFVEIEGRAFTATCTADANPQADTVWLDESGTVVGDHELKFDAVHRNDGGEYKCEATNTFWDWSTGAGSETRYLDVQYDPDIQDSEQFCLEGNNVTLHCDVDANPEPHSFSWTRDSETVSDQQNHTISSCQREDSGSYLCTAINHFYDDTEGKGDGTTVLDVQYDPVVADGLEYCIEGNSVVLVCVVEEANPYPHSFMWTRDGQFVYSGERLVIQSCDRSDVGSYKCTATSEFYNGNEGQGEGTTELIVHYPPSVHTKPLEYARESDDVELECSVRDAHPPNVVLDWILTDGTRVENSTKLYLPNVGRDFGGVYTCEGTNIFYDGSKGTGRNTTDLDVQYGPEVSDGQEHCIEGNVVELTCDVVANPPPHSITWTKDGDVVSENPTYTIDSCDRVQAGDYDCTAVNEFYDGEEGTGHGRTELLVEYTGQVTITQSTDLVLEGEELEIRCDVTDGVPDPHELSLTFGEEVLETTDSRQLIHHIAVVSRLDRGTYRCDAITRFHDSSTETITDSLEIVVQFSASILSKEEEIFAETGENVTLVCEADAYPVAAISWSDNDDQPITGDEPNREIITPEPEGTLSTSTLHITDIQDSDFGEYTCTATNDIGEDSHTTEITSRYPIGPPIILTKDVKVLEVEINDNVTLVCEADAYPVATLSWRDNHDEPITGDEPNREITTPEPKETISTSTLRIFKMQDPDFGEYTCEAENDRGHDSHTGEIIRKDPAESLLWGLLLIILLIVVLLIVFFVLLYLVLRNNRKSSKTESPDETDSRPINDTAEAKDNNNVYDNVALYPMSKKTPYPKQEKFSAYYAAQKSRESDSDMKKPTDKGSTIPEDKNMYDLYDELVEPTDKASSSMKEDTKSDGKQDTQDQESSAVDKSTEEIKVSFSADEDTLSEGNWPHLTGEQSASENLYSDMPW